jgi:hypothetical protein
LRSRLLLAKRGLDRKGSRRQSAADPLILWLDYKEARALIRFDAAE